jgi:hypothetical protein
MLRAPYPACMTADQDVDPRARGFLKAWSSGALLWSATAKRLLEGGFGEAQLAMVALHLCVKQAHLLVSGKPPRIPGDQEALADAAPFDASELKELRDTVEAFRDEILHLSDKMQDGRAVNVSWTTDPPYFEVRSSIERERGKLEWDRITKAEILDLLEKLHPWLHRQWERLEHEDDDPAEAEALAAKIDKTMRALGGS